jgi:hypothetical protein
MVDASNPVQPVSKEEMAEAFSGPAAIANKVYVTITPAGVRLAFAEGNPDIARPMFRSAVLLPFADAMSFSQVLASMLETNVKFVVPPPPQPITGQVVGPKIG